MNKTKKIVAIMLSSVMVSCFSVTCFAAGTITKTINGVKVTASSTRGQTTASGYTDRSNVGSVSVSITYRYETNKNEIISNVASDSGSQWHAGVSVSPTGVRGMIEVKGVHKVVIDGVLQTIYT